MQITPQKLKIEVQLLGDDASSFYMLVIESLNLSQKRLPKTYNYLKIK